jgi:hypothetical protein
MTNVATLCTGCTTFKAWHQHHIAPHCRLCMHTYNTTRSCQITATGNPNLQLQGEAVQCPDAALTFPLQTQMVGIAAPQINRTPTLRTRHLMHA